MPLLAKKKADEEAAKAKKKADEEAAAAKKKADDEAVVAKQKTEREELPPPLPLKKAEEVAGATAEWPRTRAD
jgi:hypothetical protein